MRCRPPRVAADRMQACAAPPPAPCKCRPCTNPLNQRTALLPHQPQILPKMKKSEGCSMLFITGGVGACLQEHRPPAWRCLLPLPLPLAAAALCCRPAVCHPRRHTLNLLLHAVSLHLPPRLPRRPARAVAGQRPGHRGRRRRLRRRARGSGRVCRAAARHPRDAKLCAGHAARRCVGWGGGRWGVVGGGQHEPAAALPGGVPPPCMRRRVQQEGSDGGAQPSGRAVGRLVCGGRLAASATGSFGAFTRLIERRPNARRHSPIHLALSFTVQS